MNKLRLILTATAGLLLFALGRYSASFKPSVTNTTQEQTITQTKRVIVRIKEPGGRTQTTVTENINAHESQSSTQKEVKQPQNKINISGLVGVDITNKLLTPVYGVSITKEVLGPITVGVWGMTNSSAGLSLGVSF